MDVYSQETHGQRQWSVSYFAGNLALQNVSDEAGLYARKEQALRLAESQELQRKAAPELDSLIVQLQAQLLLESTRGRELSSLLESTENATR